MNLYKRIKTRIEKQENEKNSEKFGSSPSLDELRELDAKYMNIISERTVAINSLKHLFKDLKSIRSLRLKVELENTLFGFKQKGFSRKIETTSLYSSLKEEILDDYRELLSSPYPVILVSRRGINFKIDSWEYGKYKVTLISDNGPKKYFSDVSKRKALLEIEMFLSKYIGEKESILPALIFVGIVAILLI